MKLALTLEYEVTDTTAEVEELLDEIVADEARGFADGLRARLAAEGVRDIQMSVSETKA